MIVEVLTEGASDVPVMQELLTRHFGLTEHEDFRIHPHRGKGKLPADIHAKPGVMQRGLLDQLPAKLRGWGKYMDENFLVVVLIDADDSDPVALVADLIQMVGHLTSCPPRVLFQVAVEETESWFIADMNAMHAAFPRANVANLQWIQPDAIVGAWERMAECIGKVPGTVSGTDKTYWAEQISPYLDFENPYSPSLLHLVNGIAAELAKIP